jgi:8-oxo-dGTP pyrophosphatase MutT (NUDIX family)
MYNNSCIIQSESVGALIVVDEMRYLLQLRNNHPTVRMAGYWGLFGGSLEAGESPEQAFRRELMEELRLSNVTGRYVSQAVFNVPELNFLNHRMSYFAIALKSTELDRLELREGEDLRAFSIQELFQQPKVTPWAVYGVYLHSRLARIPPLT